jgi:hypothetical protein
MTTDNAAVVREMVETVLNGQDPHRDGAVLR